MRNFRHLTIFSLIYLPMLFASQVIGQTFSININLYGLYFMAAVCGLRRTEAVLAMLLLGFWIDALQADVNLFGLSALWLSAFAFVCHKPSWRVVLEAHVRILGIFIQCLLQIAYLLCAFAVTHTPVCCLQFYLVSFLLSATLTAGLTSPLLRFQKKFFV
jgi:hypothetical protein